MASRKVLINYHSGKNEAPAVANVYEGELVVSHPSTAISATTIWTKNGNVMVPFASCAMTKIMIDAAVQEASKTVDVKAKDGEAFIKVETGGTEAARVFTLSSSGVASNANLTALSASVVTNKTNVTNLSAGTVSKLTTLTTVLDNLTDVVLTGVSGDTIIVASVQNPNSGSNTVNLTHRTGKQTSGFNKLATDGYGHVTGSTAVTASDIEGLGFKSSAWTEEKIASAITALDSETAVTAGKYITGIAIADGKISGITEESLPAETQLSAAVTGNGNVFSTIKVSNHKITMGKDFTAATKSDFDTLSGAAHNKITSLSAATTAISKSLTDLSAVTLTGVSMNGDNVTVTDHVAVLGDVVTEVVSAGTGNAFTGYSFTDGKLTLSKGSVATSTQGGYADSALQVVCGSTYITTNAKSGSNGKKIQTITAKQQDVETASATGQGLADAYDVKQYVEGLVTSSVNYKGATATLPASSTVGDMYITTAQIAVPAGSSATGEAQTAETGDFIIARSSGKWDVIQKNLDGAVTGSLTANTVTLGSGEHTVKSLANGTKGQVLAISGTSNTPTWVNAALTDTATTHDGHYAPTGSATGGTTATTSASAIKGLVYDDKGHVTEVITGSVLTGQTSITTKNGTTGTSASAVITGITPGGTNSHELTLNKSNKIFSASTADVAVKTVSALTFTFGDGSANVVFDGSANKTVNIPENTDTATTEEGHYTPTTSASTKGTTAATANFIKGIRIDSKNHVIDVVTGAVITAETAIAVTNNAATDTPSAVVSTVASGGTLGHSLTISKTNKVFSAQTANSAVCATTAVSAATANKVGKKLTVTDGTNSIEYDGSTAKTITFGTATSVTGSKSMSMTSAGVVDVEIIDCGTY